MKPIMQDDKVDSDDATFGHSQFKGKDDMASHLHRWFVQFVALFVKGAIVLYRRPLQLLLFLSIPSVFFLTFLVESAGGGSNSASNDNSAPIPLSDLGECDTYKDCIRVAFGPVDANTESIMTTFSEINSLTYGSDVLPFYSVEETQEFVATELGRVQYTVLFSNQSLWESASSQQYNYPIQPLQKNMSYVIFYNSSHGKDDPRSDQHGVNIPLLVLQKTLEEACLRTAAPLSGREFEAYDVDYGTLWSVPLPTTAASTTTPNVTTACDLPSRNNMDTLGVMMPWVLVFSFLLMANVSFGLVAEERKKHLFTSLRRMGLIDSAYWASWFVLFQLLLVVACSLSLITAAIVRPSSSALRELDLSLAFIMLWMCGTAFISLSFFLAALCSSSSVETTVTFGQFLVAMITIISCFTPLCTYTYEENKLTGDLECKLTASSYNTIYSDELLGNTFVQFLVWWMPFFHSAQIATDIISVLQYRGQSISLSALHSPPMPLSYDATSSDTFETKWVEWSLLMLMSNTLGYLFLAWFTAQFMSSDASEGRSLIAILLPATVRRYIFDGPGGTDGGRDRVEEGDVRGEERQMSRAERSVRAYKVSKTFSGVQALKEVSFTMKRGEVFVMLGHNGAGKSTLINIITGVLAPSHGKVFLNGLDVDRDAMDVQQTIGICSQDDLLWDDLTAREHMYLTAAFKGLRWGPELFGAVESMLARVQLTDRAQDFCRQFSGGMKRRLSVAMSTVGDVEILFLDEPTTGLDPVSRRRVWETINFMKKDRVVVLTTHNMEEADYLADSIMIMHGGHVRAFGDPLFLKQAFGKGYQVNLTVTAAHSAETQQLVSAVLPDATLVVDYTASSLCVTVPRNNLRGLPRLFTWLESSSRAALIVKEWGISNTTLEQVFLMLCHMNTEINNVTNLQKESNHRELCPMCRVNTKRTVFVRSLEGRLLIVPDSVCWECINQNDSYVVSEEQVEFALQDSATAEERMTNMLAEAQVKAETAMTQKMLALERLELSKVLETFEEYQDHTQQQQELELLQQHGQSSSQQLICLGDKHADTTDEILGTSPLLHSNVSTHSGTQNTPDKDKDPSAIVSSFEIESADREVESQVIQTESSRIPITATTLSNQGRGRPDGAVFDQIGAIFIKNAVLQSKQKCSNCCAIFFVCFMFLMLYVMSLLFQSVESIAVCDEGYLTDLDCSQSTLVDHIFSGSWNDMVEGWEGDFLLDDDVGPHGYSIKYYMIPNTEFSGNVEVFSKTDGSGYNYGFPIHVDRMPVIWSSLTESSTLVDMQESLGLQFYTRSIPEEGESNDNAPNSFMYANQQAVAASVDRSQEDSPFPKCYNFAGDFVLNTSSYATALQNYSSLFADSVFYCENCKVASELLNETAAEAKVFFEGTMWCSASPTGTCDKDSCEPYPFSFLNYVLPQDETLNYLGEFCPSGVRQLSRNHQSGYSTSTFRAMSYLNLLSNSLLRPALDSFDIQGGISAYGDLNFDAQLISQSLANVLTVIAMMLLNGFWPLAVWRLAHERTTNIVLMVHTSGMRKAAYMSGMLFFDMTISILSGIAMILFAVMLKLSRFDGAPVGYLVAIAITSAFALNGGAQLLVILSKKKASVLPMLAPCLMIASVVTSSLLNILVYPTDGDWKWPLSLYPFFAQGRAIYIVLVYHGGTPEVDVSIALMSVFGIVSLALSYVLEMERELQLEVKNWIASLREGESGEGGHSHKKVSGTELAPVSIPTDIAGAWRRDVEEGQREVDSDVIQEAAVALAYVPSQQIMDGSVSRRRDSMAIVIQRLRHVFPNGFQAVEDVSLALQYGEVFALLGPNGAGKSTIISILSGTLMATSGKQYVAGCDLQIDPKLIHKHVGICPQFDVVWHDLTVAEHLSFQARQRGVPSKRLVAEVQKAAVAVGLDGDGFYTKAGVLSGGMRRRLSIAMSIVGDPPIVFMDEPTTGLDPDNRQQVWRIIQSLKNPNRLILMTTHSMEEAEALCSRIGIMARGILQCVGTAQHLKAKFGKGYTLTVNLLPCASVEDQRTQNEQLMTFVEDTLSGGDGGDEGEKGGGSVLLSSINQTRKFLVPKSPSTTISKIFRSMETSKSHLGIREWGLSMSTLEDVFITAVEHDTTV